MATVGARLRDAGLLIGVESVPRGQELSREYGADEIVHYPNSCPGDRPHMEHAFGVPIRKWATWSQY